jgi:hypothetical protein
MPMTKADRLRAMMEERQRIDAAMATIDAAKRKAVAQREEYGKFLEWKVKMQHRERKQREEEEKSLRSRIDAKLKSVLDDHRLRKKEETERWTQFATSRAPALKESTGQLAARLQQEEEDRRKEEERLRKKETIAERLRATPKTAPMASKRGGRGDSNRLATTGYSPTVPRVGGPGAGAVDASASSGGGSEDGLTFSNEDEFQAAFPLPDVPKPRRPKMLGLSGGLDTLSAQQQAAIAAIDADRKKTAKNAALIASMFQAAKSRRLYATARMLADPPADYMLGADLMRYIPADIMGAVDDEVAGVSRRGAVPRNDTAFFLTEGANMAPGAAGGLTVVSSSDLHDVVERHQDGLTPRGTAKRNGGGVVDRSQGNRVSRWGPYDPQAWLHTGPFSLDNAPLQVEERPRDKEEEAVTLQWYKQYYEPMTRIKKRTERHQTHEWRGVEKHKLPPLASPLYGSS